jgi:hypothetical protein
MYVCLMNLNSSLDSFVTKFYIPHAMTLLKKSIFLASVLFVTQLAQSQEAIPVSGVASLGSGGSANDSVGQVFYTTHTTTAGSVSQGVQHPFEFQVLSNPALTNVNLTAVTYPNPTKDFIILKITDRALDNLRYTLFDVNGKAIASGSITESSTQVQMKYLAIGAYVLKVSQKNKALKTFKIVKQQ